MFRSYLIATIRTLLKNRGLTAINILGLAIGMACVILIALYIQYEFSYDRHHANATRIYRVFRTVSMENTTSVSPRASGALAPALKRDFPEVQEAIRTQLLTSWVKTDDHFFQQDVCVADREIFGASVFSIFGLLSKEFVKLVIIACVIASPIAYLFAGRWLQDFAYRIDLHLIYFLIGGALALLLALATLTYQALKAARTNPVDALRTE